MRKSAEPMLSKREVAEFFRVSERSVDRYRTLEGLPAYRLRGVIRFDRQECLDWLRRSQGRSEWRRGLGAGHGADSKETEAVLQDTRKDGA